MSATRISVPEAIAQLDRLSMQLLDANIESIRLPQHRVEPDEERVLEYFWDPRHENVRRELPEAVILFFEGDDLRSVPPDVVKSWAALVTRRLVNEGYLVRRTDPSGAERYLLTDGGSRYLLRRHPGMLAWWEKIMSSSPPAATFGAGVVGLLASVVAIVQLLHG